MSTPTTIALDAMNYVTERHQRMRREIHEAISLADRTGSRDLVELLTIQLRHLDDAVSALETAGHALTGRLAVAA